MTITGRSACLIDTGSAGFDEIQAAYRAHGWQVIVLSIPDFDSHSDDLPVPEWSFRSIAYANSLRLALAIEKIARTTDIALVEFPDTAGIAAMTLKRRRLLGGPLESTIISVRSMTAASEGARTRSDRVGDWLCAYASMHADQLVEASGAPASSAAVSPPVMLQPVTTPLVTVVIPFYEMHEYIEATIDSVVGSNYPEIEIVVVDDGSKSSESHEALTRLAQRAQGRPLRIVSQSNSGLGSARNRGISLARGRYVLPVDADDIIGPTMISTMVLALERNPELSAVSCFVEYFEDETTLTPVDFIAPYDLDPVLITLENQAGVASSMLRTEVFADVRYDESLSAYEDWSLWWSMAEANCRAEVIPEVLFHYRRRAGSMVRSIEPGRVMMLMERIVDAHPRLMERHGVEAFKLAIHELAATRSDLDALHQFRAQPSQSDTLALAAFREVAALRASGSWRAARRIRRLLRRPRSRLLATIVVDQVTPFSTGGVRFSDDTVYLTGNASYVGTWTDANDSDPFVLAVKHTDQPGSSVVIPRDHERCGVSVRIGPRQGVVILVQDGRRTTINLNAPTQRWVELVVGPDRDPYLRDQLF